MTETIRQDEVAAAVAWTCTVDELAQEIRRVDGNHDLGAGALAEALMPFLAALSAPVSEPVAEAGEMPGSNGGFTMATFRAVDVPVGTKLYTHPAPATGSLDREAVAALLWEMDGYTPDGYTWSDEGNKDYWREKADRVLALPSSGTEGEK